MENTDARTRLIHAARAEFLRCGYQKASLRTIAEAAGLTTGAVYFLFGSKVELFHAVVDEAADALRGMLIRGTEDEFTGAASGEDTDRAFILCLHAHPEESLILLEKADGSPLAGFRDELAALLTDGFMRFFLRAGGDRADELLIRLLVEQRMHAMLQLVALRLPLDTTMDYAVLLGAYGDAGFAGMMEQYHRMNRGSAQ